MYLNYDYGIDYEKIRDGSILQVFDYEHYYPVLILKFNTRRRGKLYIQHNGESKILKFELVKGKPRLLIFEKGDAHEVDIIDAIDPEEWEIAVTKRG